VYRARFLRPDVRVEFIQLPHLAIRSPTEIARSCIAQIHLSDFVKAAISVEARGELICDRLIVDEAVCARGADRPLV
jgi:hypothetical protein